MENEETKRAREAFELAQRMLVQGGRKLVVAGAYVKWGDLTQNERQTWIDHTNAAVERHEHSMNIEGVAEALLIEQASGKTPETRAFAIFIAGMLAGLSDAEARGVAWPEGAVPSRAALTVAHMRRDFEPRGDGGLEAVTRIEAYEPVEVVNIEDSNLTLISKTLLAEYVAAHDFRDNTLKPVEPNDETRKAAPNYLAMGNEAVRCDGYMVLRLANIDPSMRFLVFDAEGRKRSPNVVIMSHVQAAQSMASEKRNKAFSPAAKHAVNMEINAWIHGKVMAEVDLLKAGKGIDIKDGDPVL